MLRATAAAPGVRRDTSATRALVGCLSLSDGFSLGEALVLAGYDVRAASPVMFYRERCYRRLEGVRVVTRGGRIVRVSRNAHELSGWLLRLGKKLSFFALEKGRAA